MPERVLRLSTTYRHLAVVMMVFTSVMMIFSSSLSAEDVPNGNVVPLLVFAFVTWGSFFGLGVLLLTYYLRERIAVYPDRMLITELLRERSIRFKDVESIDWRANPGMIELKTPKTTVRLRLRQFALEGVVWLTQALRARIDEGRQENWAEYCGRVALPQRRFMSGAAPAIDDVVITPATWKRWFAPAAILLAVVGIGVWLFTGETRFLIAPLGVVPIWGILWLMTPAHGIPDKPMSVDPERIGFLKQLGGLLIIFLIVFGAIRLSEHLLPFPPVWYVTTAVLAVATMMTLAVRMDRLMARRAAEAQSSYKSDVAAWERLENEESSAENAD